MEAFEFELEKALKKYKLNVGESGSVPELLELEKLLYRDLELEKFTEELTKFIDREMPTERLVNLTDLLKIDDFVKKFYLGKMDTMELWVVRGFILGKLIEEKERVPTREMLMIEKMPIKVKEAVKEFDLTANEASALDYTLSHGAEHLVSATNSTIIETQKIVFDGIAKRKPRRQIRRDLEDAFLSDEGEVNRNWKRVAINESNTSFNQGYIAQLGVGEFVLGLSMPDRCDHCGKLIDGKIYPLISPTIAKDYSDLDKSDEEYKKQQFVWENAVWLNKNNVGRSTSPRKRTVNDKGEAELVDREHHELSMPCIPLHVICRCRWVRINPLTQYVENGELKMKVTDPEAYMRWYNKTVLPMMEKFSKFDINLGKVKR
jgi:hypothetical protein